MCDKSRRIAMFPGSFDPFTIGHESIVRRALDMFDEVVVAVVINFEKKGFLPLEQRLEFIKSVFADEPRVSVIWFDGLTVEAAKDCNASCLLRGVRTAQDFEYEKSLSEVYRRMSGIETVLLYTLPEYGCISSSVVRELISFGQDVTDYLPTKCDKTLLPSVEPKVGHIHK